MDDEKRIRKNVLLVAILAAFLTPFMGSALNLAIPAIGQDLRGNAIMLNWIVTSYLLVSAAFLLPFGRLADMRGRKTIFVTGVGIFGAASLLCGTAPSIAFLLGARILQGLGSAMTFSTGMALITSAFPIEERGKVLGLNAAFVYIGLSVGPILGGFLTQYLGWRSIFFLVALVSVATIWTALRSLPNDRQAFNRKQYDMLGAILISISLLALIYGASSLNSLDGAYLIALGGLMGLGLFIAQEYRTPFPIMNVRVLINNTTFAMSNLAALINYSATFSISYLLSLYLQVVRGFGAQEAGSLLLIQPLVMALISPAAGRLSDRLQPRIVSSLGMALTASGLILLANLRQDTYLPLVAATLVLQGFGFALFASPNTNAVMSSVDRGLYGVASSTLGTMRLVGQALSMAIVSFIFAAYIGSSNMTSSIAPQLMSSIRTAFFIFAIMCIAGIFASLARGDLSRKE